MKKIKDLIKKPSEALRAMIDGLQHQSKRDDFRIEIFTYGEYETVNGKKVCFGCAATCAVQEITKVNFTPDNIYAASYRAEAANIDREDLLDFEFAMDEARRGYMHKLFTYFDIDFETLPAEITRPPFGLSDENWKTQIDKVDIYIGELQELGY